MIKLTKEQAYDIQVATDERRGGNFCYSTSLALGLELSAGKGWYGGHGYECGLKDVLTFDVDGEKFSFLLKDRINVVRVKQDYIDAKQAQLRAAALSKLSDAEKMALGLK